MKSISINDEQYMLRCLDLANKGAGHVSPNPMVGAVIVKNGKMIGSGYHKEFGKPHAEVNAINSVKTSIKNATLYVNLEPCCHYGKTPPCTDLIISSGISEVKIGMLDPNPLVSGKGILQLKKAGIKVSLGILEEECKKLNEAFTKFIRTKIPFVTLKIAQTMDGKIADSNKKSKWISNEQSREFVHNLRASTDAIIVGAETINIDNPNLTTHKLGKREPIRVVIDGNLNVKINSRIFTKNPNKNIIFVSDKSAAEKYKKYNILSSKGVNIIKIKTKKDNIIPIKNILEVLGSKGISSVLVEGGAFTFSEFIMSGEVDKVIVFIAPKIFGQGISPFEYLNASNICKNIKLKNITTRMLDGDILIEAYIERNIQ